MVAAQLWLPEKSPAGPTASGRCYPGEQTMSKDKVLVYVADSPIHGKGLFAKRHIVAGEIIGLIQGVPASEDGAHVLWVDGKNGIRVQCDFRYINHSDEPNAVYYDTLEVCALRNISPGEEITHNYDGD